MLSIMKKRIVFCILCLLLITGCGSGLDRADPNSAPGAQPGQPSLVGLLAEPSGNFSAVFEMKFTGESVWIYRLETRSVPPLRETVLHIEGIDKTRNPGDIRLVSDGTTTRMIGPGTDNECIQFPNNQGMDPTFIQPGTLLPLQELAGQLSYAGLQAVSGKNLHHFLGESLSMGGWSNARIDIWQDPETLALAGLTLNASGSDPFFSSGPGEIQAQYALTGPGPAEIEPVGGCEINLPLPDSAGMLVRLPGLASFESAAAIEEIARFYQEQLPTVGWVESEAPAQAEGVIVLNFAHPTMAVVIQIEASGAGSTVKLVFNPTQ